MRENLAIVPDVAAASRASVTAAVERMKQEQSDMKKPAGDTAPDYIVLRDPKGALWQLSVDIKGVPYAVPYSLRRE